MDSLLNATTTASTTPITTVGAESSNTFLEFFKTIFGKEELYYFAWIGTIILILLICAFCVGCRACCCRACCCARETRTQLYMCKTPSKSHPLPLFKRTIKEEPLSLGCYHPHHCVVSVEKSCDCNHCSHCQVQPKTDTKVDKATNTGPTRIGFDYVHAAATPAPAPASSGQRRPSPKPRAPDPPGFRVPQGSWSYHKPNAPIVKVMEPCTSNSNYNTNDEKKTVNTAAEVEDDW